MGLCAPDGVDMLYPVGDKPWDLTRMGDQVKCEALLDELDPRVAHFAPPCTELSIIGSRPEPGSEKYEKGYSTMKFSVDQIGRRKSRGGEGSLESPLTAATWRLEIVLEEFGSRDQPRPGRFFARPDLCQFDLKEPVPTSELYWKKGVVIAATFPEVILVDVRCDGSHLHQHIRGSVKTEAGRWKNRAALSAAYPEKLGLAWGLVVCLVSARLGALGVKSAGVKTKPLSDAGPVSQMVQDAVCVVTGSPSGLIQHGALSGPP